MKYKNCQIQLYNPIASSLFVEFGMQEIKDPQTCIAVINGAINQRIYLATHDFEQEKEHLIDLIKSIIDDELGDIK